MKREWLAGFVFALASTIGTAQAAGTFELSVSPQPTIPEIDPLCRRPPPDHCEAYVAFVVRRTGGSAGQVTVDLDVVGGTATNDVDYTFNFGFGKKTFVFPDGFTDERFTILVAIPDTEPEPPETVIVALSNPTGGATIGAASSVTVTILDVFNGNGIPTLSEAALAGLAVLLAASGAVLTLKRG